MARYLDNITYNKRLEELGSFSERKKAMIQGGFENNLRIQKRSVIKSMVVSHSLWSPGAGQEVMDDLDWILGIMV